MKVAKKGAQLEQASVALIDGRTSEASELLKQARENLDAQAMYTEQCYGDLYDDVQERLSCLEAELKTAM